MLQPERTAAIVCRVLKKGATGSFFIAGTISPDVARRWTQNLEHLRLDSKSFVQYAGQVLCLFTNLR